MIYDGYIWAYTLLGYLTHDAMSLQMSRCLAEPKLVIKLMD